MADDQTLRPLPGGKLEYAVLAAIWEGGTVTARDVHRLVGLPLGLVYTTITRVLDRLFAKGLVSRERSGKLFHYRASAPRVEIDRARISRSVAGFLTTQPRPALATLVDAIEAIDPELLDELAHAVDARRRSRGEP